MGEERREEKRGDETRREYVRRFKTKESISDKKILEQKRRNQR